MEFSSDMHTHRFRTCLGMTPKQNSNGTYCKKKVAKLWGMWSTTTENVLQSTDNCDFDWNIKKKLTASRNDCCWTTPPLCSSNKVHSFMNERTIRIHKKNQSKFAWNNVFYITWSLLPSAPAEKLSLHVKSVSLVTPTSSFLTRHTNGDRYQNLSKSQQLSDKLYVLLDRQVK
jgi:hypothetical protein